jgi:hypothetical protein
MDDIPVNVLIPWGWDNELFVETILLPRGGLYEIRELNDANAVQEGFRLFDVRMRSFIRLTRVERTLTIASTEIRGILEERFRAFGATLL